MTIQSSEKTKEPQYQNCIDIRNKKGLLSMGLRGTQVWTENPKQMLFILARYKFVAKMFSGLEGVLEIGCGDGLGTRLVQQEVGHVTALDFDKVFIDDFKQREDPDWSLTLKVHDMLDGSVEGQFDGIYSLDVLEHIQPSDEDRFITNTIDSLKFNGSLIIGMPSIESQKYASAPSKAGHVNCKSAEDFKKLMEKYFYNVFIFSMNDEVLHTGFYQMSHYIFTLCCNKKPPS
jgi:cyclopropane fatty-acyl-phospholipid synthase-like methyltransferase